MRSRLAHASAGLSLSRLFTRLVLVLSTVSILGVTAAPALASQPANLPATAASQAQRQQAETQTLALGRLMAAYRHADAAEQTNLLNELIEQARARQALLAELAHTDPSGALRAVLPAQVRAGMPAEVQALLEQKREVEGELEIFYEDYEDGRHRLRHVLNTGTDRIELQLPTAAQSRNLQTGSSVRARGWLFRQEDETAGSLVLNDEPQSLEVLADGATTSSTSSSSPAVLPNTLGEQKVLVLLVNFQDNPVQPWTQEQARSMVFDTVNAFYQENSSNQTWLTGDVQGYFTLPALSVTEICDGWAIHVYAQQAAQAEGIDLSGYNRFVYVFPGVSTCGWTGKGTLGGTPSMSWINGSLSLRTVGHELGHNFGLQHAEQLECGSAVIGDPCISITYGDSMDIMGESGITGHFNMYNKELLGWLTAEAGEVATAEGDGSYLLAPYESAASGTARGLKVRRGTDSVTGQPLWYYLEYRQAVGFDSFLDGKPVTSGVVFHLDPASSARGSQLLDMTPASTRYDLDDAALLNGSSYTDPDAGVTVTTDWADASGASVTVSYAGQSCIRANPTLSLSPSESAWVSAGSTVAYTATLTNRDSSGCAASDFNLSALLPAGWSASSASLNLAPGASGTVTLSVTSASNAADGFYDLTISAVSSSDANYASSGSVTYVVQAPAPVCAPANPTLVLTASPSQPVLAGSSVTYTATLTNRDSSACAASVFDVGASVPAGWSAGSASVSLAPGASTSVNVSVTSASSAAEGQYAISLLATNRSEAGFGTSLQTSYAVAAPTPVCVAADPLLTLTPVSSGAVVPGSTVTYSLTLSNRDSSDCTASDFALSAQLPAGWSAGSANVHLAPGASTTLSLAITTAADAADGSYAIAIQAENLSAAGYGSSVPASIAVAAPANQAPVAVDDSLALSAKVATSIGVLANDSDPDQDPLTVVSVTQGAKGSVQIAADGSLLYTPAKSFKDGDSFTYTISDGEKVATATVTVALVNAKVNNK